MVLNKVQGRSEVAPQSISTELTAQVALKRPLLTLATICLAFLGVPAIAPSALSQSATVSLSAAWAVPDAPMQHSTCVSDPQGLMCNTSNHEIEKPLVASQADVQTATVLQPLTNAQMEQLSDTILGFLYFVLPIGCGLGLFLYDRHQAYRATLLDAQIKLLEKLWEQSPHA